MYKVGDRVVIIGTSIFHPEMNLRGTIGEITEVDCEIFSFESIFLVKTEEHELYFFSRNIKPYNDFKKKYLLLEQILNNI